jgi:uncharacterized protein (DUF433 family)
MSILDYIITDSNRYNGGGILKDTDHSVSYILLLLGEGKTIDEILIKHPEIKSAEAIKAALIWASENLQINPIYTPQSQDVKHPNLIEESKLIMDNALSYAFVQSGLCECAMDLQNFQLENGLPQYAWLYYYWKYFFPGAPELTSLMIELRSKYGLPIQESLTGSYNDIDVTLNYAERKIITPEVVQLAIIEKSKFFASQEIETHIYQQETKESADEYFRRQEESEGTKGNRFYNDNLDMDQQSQDFWDDSENQADNDAIEETS